VELLWGKQIKMEAMWEPELSGVFSKSDEGVTFFFHGSGSILALPSDRREASMIHTFPPNEEYKLPGKWIVVNDESSSFLFPSGNCAIEMNSCTVLDQIPEHVYLAYKKQLRPLYYYEEADFVYNEYTISHKGFCGYICKKNGIQQWYFRGQAYLYTEIYFWENRIIFGTSGNGGYLYILDLNTGKPVAAVKTGGTENFILRDNRCFVLSNEKTAQLLCLDLADGSVISKCNLPGKATSNSRLALIDEVFHAITFYYRKPYDPLDHAIWSAVKN